MVVDRVADLSGVAARRSTCATWPSACTPASVRRPRHLDVLAAEPRTPPPASAAPKPVGLTLPAAKARRHIRSSACSGAWRAVPGATGSESRAERPPTWAAAGALQPGQPERALAAGDRQTVVEHLTRRAGAGRDLAVSTRTRSPRPRTSSRATGRARAAAAPARRPAAPIEARFSLVDFDRVSDALSGCGRGAGARRQVVERGRPCARRSSASPSCRLAAVRGAIGTRSMQDRPGVQPLLHLHDGDAGLRSPARIARWIGAAPRQRGSSDACTLMQPGAAPRGWLRQDQPIGGDHREVGAEGGEHCLLGGVLRVAGVRTARPSRRPPRGPARAAPQAAPGRPRRLRVDRDHLMRPRASARRLGTANAAVPM